jgi:trans-AT polyketide synthase, acyltransferase and oxidoreductase domains
MKLPVVWMFSGQGAQYFQMGAPLYAADAVFRETVDDCSRRLEPRLGAPINHILYQPRADRFEPFVRTRHSHAALFAVQYALAQTLRHRGHRPDFLLGYSLGEFVAYAVAGCLSLDDALQAVCEHAFALEAHAPHGAMLAVVDRLEIIDRFPAEFAELEIAAENYAGHFAVAGTVGAVDNLQRALRAAGINFARLTAEYAFHSSQIAPAAPAFARFAETLRFAPPQVPVISAERGRVVRAPQAADLWRVTAHRVHCRATIEIMEDYGAYRYIDLGPSGTMANFVKYNLRPGARSQLHAIMTPFRHDLAALSAAEAHLREN